MSFSGLPPFARHRRTEQGTAGGVGERGTATASKGNSRVDRGGSNQTAFSDRITRTYCCRRTQPEANTATLGGR